MAGLTAQEVGKFVPKVSQTFDEEQVKIALANYNQEQQTSELELVSKIEEIVPPGKLLPFARCFIRGNTYLAHPLFVRVLNLDKNQVESISHRCTKFRQVHKRMRDEFESEFKKPRDNSATSPTPTYITHPDFRRAYLLPFADLSPTQFRMVAELLGLIQPQETFAEYRKRIKGVTAEVLGALAAAGETEELAPSQSK